MTFICRSIALVCLLTATVFTTPVSNQDAQAYPANTKRVEPIVITTKDLADAHMSIKQPTPAPKNRVLARITYYTKDEDYYSSRGQTSTGEPLRSGVCAVNPDKIPFYKHVHVEGIGTFRALDSGSAVVSRKAAREAARTKAEHNALVVDIYCRSQREAARMEANNPLYAYIAWD
jgi:3D (Asp-Asp-Asp) domain-containing protein